MEEQLKARLIGATILVVLVVALVPELLSGRKPAAPPPAVDAGKPGTRTITIDLGGAVAAGSRLAPAPATANPAARGNLPEPPPAADPAGQQASNSSPEQGGAAAAPTATSTATSTASDHAPESQPTPASAAAASTAARSASSQPVVDPAGNGAATPRPNTPGASTPQSSATATTGSVAAAGGHWSVQVGAFGSADAAHRLVGNLKREGFSAYVAPLNRPGKTLHRVRVGPEPGRADADKLAARLKARGLPASVVTAD